MVPFWVMKRSVLTLFLLHCVLSKYSHILHSSHLHLNLIEVSTTWANFVKIVYSLLSCNINYLSYLNTV